MQQDAVTRALVAWIVPVLLLATASGLAHAAVPETPRFRIIGAEQGLPSTDFYGLARDQDGYVWIATGDGLARYDGLGMQVWRHDPGDPGSLPGNNVQFVHIDARDRVWVATENGGLSVLDRERRHWRHFRKAEHPEMGSDDVWAIASRGDTLWFGNYDGGLHRMAADGTITHFGHDDGDADSLPSDTIMSLVFDAAGTLWIGTARGLARFDRSGLHRVAMPGADPAPRLYSVSLVGDALWIGASDGIHRLGADGRWSSPEWSPMFERPNALVKVARDREGAYWLGSQRGLWRVLPGQVPAPVALGTDIPKPISAMLQQPDGALWVPVAGKGLGYLRSDWRRIAQFSRAPGGLEGDLYRALAPARRGGVWLGGYNGAVEHLGSGGRIERLDDAERERLKDARLYAIVEDHSGNLWLGQQTSVVRVGIDGTVEEWAEDDALDPVPSGWIDQLRIAPDGTLWLSSQGGGIQQRDPASGKVLRTIAASDETGLGLGDTEAMEFTPGGALWIAGATGIARLDATQTRFVPIEAMRGERVFGFAFDGPDAVWLQRLGGLERYERGAEGWRRSAMAGVREGLPSVGAGGVRVDGRHRVWMSTPRGLFRWDPAKKQLRHYGVQQGLSSQEFVDRAIALTSDGMLAAGTADGGVVLVDTVAPDPPGTMPTLRFDSFAVRREGRWQDLPLHDAMMLSPGDHEFRVSARLLAFDDPTSNHYWSRLEGFDSDWVQQGASGERSFTGLPSGRYVLHQRATDAAGNASAERRLRLTVMPPWWRTLWARLAFTLAAIAMLWWLANGYRQRLKRRSAWQLNVHKRELAEQASLAKTRFLATLGHEVRTPMTGVLGMSELLLATDLDLRQRGYTESIRRAGDHLMRLVNDALDLARIEAGKLELDLQPFDLQALVHDVAGLMAPIARQRGLAFEHAIAAGTPGWLCGDAVRIRQILLNLLGNAIKFTDQGEVTLRVEAPTPPGIRMIVADTGPGLNAEQKQRLFRRFEQAEGARTAARYGGSGLGLAICQELAASMGGRIEVESQPGKGTRFIVELPLATASATTAAAVAHPDATPPPRAALDLLLVEDDATIAEVITGLLQAQGHRVVHVAHGLGALAEVAGTRFDLALLDLDLPGIDGFALARQLRAQGFARPLLAVTARADAEAESQAREASFDGFLRKPLTGRMLAEAIESLVPEGGNRTTSS